MASDIKLVFYSSTITMMHGPTNIRMNVFQNVGGNTETHREIQIIMLNNFIAI